MSDTHESPALPQSDGSKTYKTRTGEIIGTSVEAAKVFAGFTPTHIMMLATLVLILFLCISQVIQGNADREERRSVARERQDAAATLIRENNAQTELMRQHCSSESASLRAYFAEQNDRRMRFEAEERVKDRSALTSLLESFDQLRKTILKKFDG